MRPKRACTVLCIILFFSLLFLFTTHTADATIEQNYLASVGYGNPSFTTYYNFSAKVTIETDANNTWVVGKSYTITYTITLGGVDPSMEAGFQLFCYSPEIIDVGNPSLQYSIVNNSTDNLTILQPTGQLSVSLKVEQAKQYSLEFVMYLETFQNGESSLLSTWLNTRDSASGPTYVIAKASPSPQPLLTIGTVVAVVVVIVGVGMFYSYRKHAKNKRRTFRKQTRPKTPP